MKALYSFILLAGSTLFCLSANADWTNYSKVKRLYPHITDETIYLKLSAGTINPGNSCSGSDWYAINVNDALSKEIFSLLLAAQKSGSSVRIFIDGCHLGRPKVIAVQDQ